MTNETKEKIREEFRNKFQDGDFEGSADFISDYWLEKLDLAVKEERARLVEKIVSIPIKNESGSDYEMAQLRYREKVISLINQDK